MTVAQEIDQFFRKTKQSVFIEAEAKESRMRNFISEYNSKYSPNIEISDNGIISLANDANKWGLELRCYFDNRNGFPDCVQITKNRVYRSEHPYRFNDVGLISELFELGYRIGDN